MIRRYTTPVQELIVEGVDLTGKDVYVTFQQKSNVSTYTGSEITVESDGTDSTVSIHFTQIKTAGFEAGRPVKVQVNWMDSGERNATEIKEILITRNLLEEVIEDG